MLKKISVIIAMIFLTVGCDIIKDTPEDKSADNYRSYFKAIEDNESFLVSSKYYTISAEMSKPPKGTNNYYIFLDTPQIAMYDIKMLAIDLDSTLETSTNMTASIGIFEKQKYSLVPFQVNNAQGYYKGLMMSGETTKDEVNFGILVTWYSSDREKSYKEFIKITLNLDGVVVIHDDIVEENK